MKTMIIKVILETMIVGVPLFVGVYFVSINQPLIGLMVAIGITNILSHLVARHYWDKH